MVVHTMVEYTTAGAERTAFSYTMAALEPNVEAVQTVVVVVQPATTVAVVVSPLIGVIFPSCSTYPLYFLGTCHILDNPFLHDQ